ncbi:hypothetical protein J7E99_11725 [Streptomyces sp. ISL-44]|uniref:hypothetical protein n=1 Tax=Streptomyces sp. ISL-44 TaxID=2819184 RepID=UPI001BECEC9E|nr:hypothetical protein [Streptomyces sp. ISL-44]MBT2541359.1 hypothetical protein [Streptomyces sp. ISL-44]
MTAFDATKNTPAMKFADLDGHPITVRPIFDAGMGRNVVELVVNGTAVKLSNASVPKFVDGVTMAAVGGEIENVALDADTPVSE